MSTNKIIKNITEGIENYSIRLLYQEESQVEDLRRQHIKYVRNNVSVSLDSDFYYDGCDCTDNCESSECGCKSTHGYFYNSQISGLDPNLVQSSNATFNHTIYECNSLCACSNQCQNRLVQHGISLPLEIFRTSLCGWGVRVSSSYTNNQRNNQEKDVDDQVVIKQGQFVCEYAGEIIKTDEARRRWRSYKSDYGITDNYIFCIREHIGKDRVLRTNIDPTRVGNIGRYINHSCSPNLRMFLVRVNSIVPIAALFATREIRENEELSFDYSGQIGMGIEDEKINNNEEDSVSKNGIIVGERKPCFCGSENCCGYLPFDESL
ncbi:2203_t:CDS:2 [Ambispora gerdemannii]|uniref:2203_t:CDS:1 n=1 Tax=Ambispora gerdemannii TaxID=144530 RepID=A0A9N9FVU2_9GLOM|nr:2203_t:CDS:2 [Ambispora gerdemannii]